MATQVLMATSAVTTKPVETLTTAGQTTNLNPSFPLNSYSFTNGTSTTGTVASVVDQWWAKSGVTLASSASTTYTLSSLTDDLGRTIAFVRVRLILLQVTTRTGNDYLTIGGAAANPWAAIVANTNDLILIRDMWHLVDNSPAAYVVASGSSDQLKILNSGSASMVFSILLVGNTT